LEMGNVSSALMLSVGVYASSGGMEEGKKSHAAISGHAFVLCPRLVNPFALVQVSAPGKGMKRSNGKSNINNKIPLENPAERTRQWVELVDNYATAHGLLIDAEHPAVSAEMKGQIAKDLEGRAGFASKFTNAEGEDIPLNQDVTRCLQDVLEHFAATRGGDYQQGMNMMAYTLYLIGLNGDQIYYGLQYLVNEIGVGYFEHGQPGLMPDIHFAIELAKKDDRDFEPRTETEWGYVERLLFGWSSSLMTNKIHLSTVADELSVSRALEPEYKDMSEDAKTARKEELMQGKDYADQAVRNFQSKELVKLWDVILLEGRDGWLGLLTAICKGPGRRRNKPVMSAEEPKKAPVGIMSAIGSMWSRISNRGCAVEEPEEEFEDEDTRAMNVHSEINSFFEGLIHEKKHCARTPLDQVLSNVYPEIQRVKDNRKAQEAERAQLTPEEQLEAK